MIHLGLSSAEQKKFHAALTATHSVSLTVHVLNMNGETLAVLDNRIQDGQVNVDADSEVTRSCTLAIYDPNRTLAWASDSPEDGSLYLDRMVRVVYSVKVDTVGWVDVPVFTGPLTKASRSGDIVNVEAQGKESLALGMAWHPLTLKKGHRKTAAIRTILSARAGEDRFDLPDLNVRIPRTVSLGRESIPWHEAKLIATSMDRQLFYDGRGVCRLRGRPGHAFTFRTGNSEAIVTPVQVDYSLENVRNTIWIKGGKPRGVKTDDDPDTPAPKSVPDVRFRLVAPSTHPLSPARLGRNGVGRFLVEVIENTRVRSVTEARRLARSRLDSLLMESVSVSFESLPIPHLEPLDIVRVATDEGSFQVRVRQFSIPLGVSGTMSVGFLKRVSTRSRRRNHR